MKQIKWNKKLSIPALCYAVCALFWLLSGVWTLGRDLVSKAAGSQYEFSLNAENFELVNMHEEAEGVYVNENGDPQMIWKNTDGITLRTLRMEAEFSYSPREMCLYYTEKPDEPFGVNKRVFAHQQNDGSYLYTLPAGKVAALRLDPCSPDEDKIVEMQFGDFKVNEPVPFWKYFAPGWYGFFKMLLYPALTAAALSLAQSGYVWYKSKRKK